MTYTEYLFMEYFTMPITWRSAIVKQMSSLVDWTVTLESSSITLDEDQ